jgi:hypothetical protein
MKLLRPTKLTAALFTGILLSTLSVRSASATYANLSDNTGTNASDITGTNASDITGTNASDITGTNSADGGHKHNHVVANPALVAQAHQLAHQIQACAASNCSQLGDLKAQAHSVLSQMKQHHVGSHQGRGGSASHRLW